jgi:hypothetical protein
MPDRITDSNTVTDTNLVNNEPKKAPAAPVPAIIANILKCTSFCLKCLIAAVNDASVLIPIFVPAVTAAEVSVVRIRGNRRTPRTNPTSPPTNPIARPSRPRRNNDDKDSIDTISQK